MRTSEHWEYVDRFRADVERYDENIKGLAAEYMSAPANDNAAFEGQYGKQTIKNLIQVNRDLMEKASEQVRHFTRLANADEPTAERAEHPTDIYRGGKSSGRSRSKKAHTKNPLPSSSPKWVSTGRQTTLKDGSKRTVYRNSKTGDRATKRMVERNGKRTAKYVKLS
jgi:hypothetical protein